MKKIYLIKYDNGEMCEDYEEYTFNFCYSNKQIAKDAMEILKNNKYFLESIISSNLEEIRFWIEEITLCE